MHYRKLHVTETTERGGALTQGSTEIITE